ncbi:MAG: hypothetical protein U0Q22_14845 [Acidimicrobiales bacterium]
MRMKSLKRWVAVGLTASLAAIGLEVATPVVAGATQVDLVCNGVTGDNASSLGDSKTTLGLLATVTGSGAGLSFSAEITTDAPAKVTPSGGAFDANFDLTLTLPASLITSAKTLLGLSAVEVKNATYAIQASGAADNNLSVSVPSQIIDLNANPVVVKQRVSGKIEPKRAGAITYRPGTNTALTIVIGKSVAGVQINALTVSCGATKDIGQTAVQIPGAPNIVQPIYQGAYTATVVGRPLIGKEITPDNGNPITPDSLAVTKQAPNGGYTAVGGGAAFFLAPQEPGLYNAEYQVCAASKIVPEVPGVNTVQVLNWPESYVGKALNAHPLSMRLSFKGVKSAPISLSSFLGNPSPMTEVMAGFADRFLAQFTPPSAGALQAALEGISTIGPGNVTVSGGAGNTPYTITFKGALGLADQPKIEVTDWETWLPASGLTSVLDALKPPAPAPGQSTTTTTTAVPETAASLDAKLGLGQITFQQWLDGRLNLLKTDLVAGLTSPATITALTSLFPKTPEFAVTVNGKPTVPQTETGPLCSAFTIGYFVVRPPAVVQGASITRYKTVTKCSYKRVKVKGKYVKKKVCSKVRVKA